MKNIVRLSESEIKKIIKKIITERLGVPDNITKTSELIYNQIIQLIDDSSETNEIGDTFQKSLYGDYGFMDLRFNEILLEIKTSESSEPNEPLELYGLTVSAPSHIDKDYNIVKNTDFSKIKLTVQFAVGENVNWGLNTIKSLMLENKSLFVSSLSHELHHVYDTFKIPFERGTRRPSYQSFHSLGFGVMSINEFLFYCYFAHAIENVVRTSEFYSYMESKEITKSQFKEFFNENHIIKKLKWARDFKLDDLISKLHNEIPRIDNFLAQANAHEHFDIPFDITDSKNDTEKIYLFLNLVFKYVRRYQENAYLEFLYSTKSPLDDIAMMFAPAHIKEKLIQDENKRRELFNSFKAKLKKYKNYQDFFGNEEKRLNFVGEKLIRKLAKLYAMAKDDVNEEKSSVILNWEKYHDVNKTHEKTIEEVKKMIRDMSKEEKDELFNNTSKVKDKKKSVK